ncbi:MAG: hypothetical protein WC375_07090 [Methanomassiliicoccales archaeon]|jgi:hypothetical protein
MCDLPYSQWSTKKKYLFEKRFLESAFGTRHERDEAEKHLNRVAKIGDGPEARSR